MVPNKFTGGIGAYEFGNRSVDLQVSAKATRLYRSHELRVGWEYDGGEYSLLNQRTGPTFVTVVGQRTATGATVSVLADPNFGSIARPPTSIPSERHINAMRPSLPRTPGEPPIV